MACLFKIFFLVLLQAEPLSLADHKHKHKARVASFDKAQFLFPLWVHHWVHCGYNVGRLWVDHFENASLGKFVCNQTHTISY